MENCLDDLIPTRKGLLDRLKNWDDNESWRDFFDTYRKLIYGFAMQRGLSHQESEDVVQDTILAVAKNIQKFEYDPAKCAFKTWLLTVTRSKIANQFDRRMPKSVVSCQSSDDTRLTSLMNLVPDDQHRRWELAWDDEWQKSLMEAALQRVKRRVSIEQYQMFDLFVIKNWPARDVSKTLGVTVAHVYVVKHRISKLIRREVADLEKNGG